MNHPSTILIVDDEPAGRETLKGLLIGQGYNLAFAGDGLEALAIATELTPDLILLDVMLPGMDGFEVCRRLRAEQVLAEVPVVMVTALDDRDFRLQGIEAGADDFISKPFDRAELRARVRTITRLNRYRRLLAERAKFEWVVEHADNGYLMVSRSDNVLYANPQSRRYLGLSENKNEPISETFLTLAGRQYHLEPKEAWASWPEQPVTDLPLSRFLVLPESTTASAFWLQVDVMALPAGLDNGLLVCLRDITLESALQKNIMNFHAAIYHKLRTPLTSILGGLELLANGSAELLPGDVAGLADAALRGAKRLHGEIEDILQYLSAPRLAKAGAGFPLAQLAPTVSAISSDLQLTSVEITGHEDLGNARTLLSRHAFELVLREVLENAKKFHPKQSPKLEVSCSQAGLKQVGIQIRDDGVTLTPEQLARVWIPYHQGEKYLTGQMAGMGLGLPLVASLIWNVGGSCHIYNRAEGTGVVVEFTLPLE